MTSKEILLQNFESARKMGAEFVFVVVSAEGVEEVISIPSKSFDAKEQFYKNAYDDNLVHVMNSNVKITSVAYGQSDILKDLLLS